MLKRVSAALENGDTIRAVIRNSVILQDEGIAGITTPSSETQESTIRAAYAAAGLDLANTSYVETNRSGTSIGDLTESRAIGSVIGKARQEDGHGPVTLGSIKGNIGQLGSASGLAAVIKAVLMLHKGQIPQAVNAQRPDQDIEWKSWHLNLPTQNQDLDSLRISLYSLGCDGTNNHMILYTMRKGKDTVSSSLEGPSSLISALSARSSKPHVS